MSRTSSSRAAVIAGGAVAAVLVAGGVGAALAFGGGSVSAPQARGSAAPPPPAATVAFVGAKHDQVPWNHPLQLAVTNGRFTQVQAFSADGSMLDGALSDQATRWVGTSTLVPLTTYTVTVDYVDLLKKHHRATMTMRAADSAEHLTATLSPGDGDVVGVGMPVTVYFNRWVPEADRMNVELRLAVATNPQVAGAWHWMNGQEVHWRPPTYWKPGTHVTVTSNLDHLDLGKGVWGSGQHTARFQIGTARFSVVDVARHTMSVYENGRLLRSMAISAGRDKYPTMGGIHIALEKAQMVVMDSATVGIPRNSPDGYYEKVYWNVRISNGGAFVHAAPWSVAEQGRVNVSHGCVNLAPANAQWFYYLSQRGDVVSIYNTPRGPSASDPGTSDWNMSWSQWLAGQAAPVTDEQRAAASTYHGAVAPAAPAPPSYTPPAPAATTTATTARTPSPTASATPKPTASPH
jgi:lipoprotein-anchoring transpeptidase ErfK/SrfK